MKAGTVQALHSTGYAAVRQFFVHHEPPFSMNDIREFNAMYKHTYPELAPIERQRSEELVDYLIAHVEHHEWAGKIYGVV